MRRGQNEEARAAYDQAVANYRQTVLSAFQSVEDNLAMLRILGTEVQLRQTAAKSSNHFLELSQTRFKAGLDSFFTVSAAQTAELANQNGVVQTQLLKVTASVIPHHGDGGRLGGVRPAVRRPISFWCPPNNGSRPARPRTRPADC